MANNGNKSESSVSGTESMERIIERVVTSFLQALQTNKNNGMPERQEELVIIKQFQDLKPTTFTGDLDPMVADAWVKDMENIFHTLPYTERQKINGLLANITIEPTLIKEIKARQCEGKLLKKKYEEQRSTLDPDFTISNGTLKFQNRICVPNLPELKKKILVEAHSSRFIVHPGNTKMYHDLKEHYWWTGMKRDITSHVPKCLHC
ncbi:uncharacterized protein LOC114280841 [Camellia sinensis]|uniref:uncharacterized protein LOC114280841 n=1 Tax=Camellia sinensis TaxID=4442 RepID=UPI0010364F40|nr:uncharacterized protein LOC114280841 [Camellia sinensis]